ncbi:MAG: SDR family oxidoreductase [bacterium]|nr:SDR family oxidoreductase [bacterium]
MSEKVWFITGCATGFGAALAQMALDRGERVVATDKDIDALQHLRTLAPDKLLPLQLDVTQPGDISVAVAKAITGYGRIDVLVNNAGLGYGGAFEEMDLARNRLLFEVNILGMMALTQQVLPHMRQAGRGHLINVSSDSGIYGQPFQTAYTATKYAVEGFSEALSHELLMFGIKVTVIEPCGMFATAMPRDAVAEVERLASPDSPYYPLVQRALPGAKTNLENALPPSTVAEAILEVATLENPPLRRAVGLPERTGLLDLRRQMPDEDFINLIRSHL